MKGIVELDVHFVLAYSACDALKWLVKVRTEGKVNMWVWDYDGAGVLLSQITWPLFCFGSKMLNLCSFSCVGVDEDDAPDIDIYHCPNCEKTHGKSTRK